MRPSFLDNMSWAMAEVYGAVTDRILVNLARYFPYIKDADEIRGSFEYQARMLGQVGQVNRETADIIMQSLGGADAALRQALEAAILDALKNEEPKLRKAAQKGLLQGGGLLPPEVMPNQLQAFTAYYQQSADKLNLVNTVMLESTQAAYAATVTDVAARIGRTQSILNVGAGEVVTGVSAWNTAMHDAVRKMVDNGLTGFVDHGGHKWSPEAYVAMDIRTTMFNTSRAAVWERANSYGADLYQVSSHNGARPLCYPWQGKVISRSDWTGEVEDLEGNKVHVYAQSETSYGEAAGLFGVNCKHYPMTFIPGFSALRSEPQDPEENAEAYALSQQQRGLERKLRQEKRDLAVMKAQGANEDALRAQRERVNSASNALQDFCDENGLPRRRSREYTPINAKFPPGDSYDPTQFPTETRDRVREFYGGAAGAVTVPVETPPVEAVPEAPAQADVRAEPEASASGKAETYTESEKGAVEYYVSGDGMWVNRYLRDPSGYVAENGPLSAEDKELIHDLDSATEKEVVSDKLLYRSVDAQAVFGRMTDMEFENLRGAIIYGDTSKPAQMMAQKARAAVGKTITEKGYMSTTRDAETAYQWDGFTGSTKDIALELHLPDGIRGFDVENVFEVDKQEQHEVLLQRGLKYRVDEFGKRETEDGTVIYVAASILKKEE
jgi:hypothetical protein